MNRAPKLSVLMTVYNGGRFLQPAIESVRDQSFKDWEFIIVDDGSTDGTAAFLDRLEDPRFVIIHRENGGTAAAANQGLEHCRGEYTARMDADDISLPSRFEKQIEFLDKHTEIGLLGTQIAPMGDRGVGKSLHLPLRHEEIDGAMMEGKHALAHSAIMMRTKLLKDIGGYWKHRLVDDWDMMLRMCEVAKVANLAETLHHYRIHRGSLNGKQMKRMRFSIDYACELARRRRANRESISPEAFEQERSRRSFWSHCNETVDLFARCHYRLALAEILGGVPWIGYPRMLLAALCRPNLTIQRVARMIRSKLAVNR